MGLTLMQVDLDYRLNTCSNNRNLKIKNFRGVAFVTPFYLPLPERFFIPCQILEEY